VSPEYERNHDREFVAEAARLRGFGILPQVSVAPRVVEVDRTIPIVVEIVVAGRRLPYER
jgi:hypothetical protein